MTLVIVALKRESEEAIFWKSERDGHLKKKNKWVLQWQSEAPNPVAGRVPPRETKCLAHWHSAFIGLVVYQTRATGIIVDR